MRLEIHSNYEVLSNWAANYIVRRINDFHPTKDRPFVLGLPTGSTPLGTYRALIDLYQKGMVSFKNVVTFNMDEYVGLDKKNPKSFHYFMHDHFFRYIDILQENIHMLNGTADDPEAECVAYEEKIKVLGGIDLFLGGMGSDGHLAFNVPGSPLQSRTRKVKLNYETIVANSRFFGNDVDKVPRYALTVGVQTVMEAREVLVLVSGYNKARALKNVVEGGVSHMCTVSALQLHPCATIACDEEATMELKVGTVKLFKGQM